MSFLDDFLLQLFFFLCQLGETDNQLLLGHGRDGDLQAFYGRFVNQRGAATCLENLEIGFGGGLAQKPAQVFRRNGGGFQPDDEKGSRGYRLFVPVEYDT